MRGWNVYTRKRADKEHARKKQARAQRQHLKRIKNAKELRRIMLSGRYGYKV